MSQPCNCCRREARLTHPKAMLCRCRYLMFSHVKLWVSRNSDHSWSPLQDQFSAKKLCAQALYVIIHEKSEYHTTLTVSSMVVEQQVKKVAFAQFFSIQKKSVEIETKL